MRFGDPGENALGFVWYTQTRCEAHPQQVSPETSGQPETEPRREEEVGRMKENWEARETRIIALSHILSAAANSHAAPPIHRTREHMFL